MIPVHQTEIHDPDNDKYGDCYRACLASVLELPITEVPHIARMQAEGKGTFWEIANEWLASKGLFVLQVRHQYGEAHPFPFGYCAGHAMYHILSSPSPRQPDAIWHSVVACNGVMVFDPHPDQTGLTPQCEKYPTWEYEFILPKNICVQAYQDKEVLCSSQAKATS